MRAPSAPSPRKRLACADEPLMPSSSTICVLVGGDNAARWARSSAGEGDRDPCTAHTTSLAESSQVCSSACGHWLIYHQPRRLSDRSALPAPLCPPLRLRVARGRSFSAPVVAVHRRRPRAAPAACTRPGLHPERCARAASSRPPCSALPLALHGDHAAPAHDAPADDHLAHVAHVAHAAAPLLPHHDHHPHLHHPPPLPSSPPALPHRQAPPHTRPLLPRPCSFS